jgi:hypothetical protein
MKIAAFCSKLIVSACKYEKKNEEKMRIPGLGEK